MRHSSSSSNPDRAPSTARQHPIPPRSAAPPLDQTLRQPQPHPPHPSRNVPNRPYLQEGPAPATRLHAPSGMTSPTFPRWKRSVAPFYEPIHGHKAVYPCPMQLLSSVIIRNFLSRLSMPTPKRKIRGSRKIITSTRPPIQGSNAPHHMTCHLLPPPPSTTLPWPLPAKTTGTSSGWNPEMMRSYD